MSALSISAIAWFQQPSDGRSARWHLLYTKMTRAWQPLASHLSDSVREVSNGGAYEDNLRVVPCDIVLWVWRLQIPHSGASAGWGCCRPFGTDANSVNAGAQGFTLTVNGNNFNTNAVVNWGGAQQTPTYVTGKQLTTAIRLQPSPLLGRSRSR